jgi:hypothetical protein
MRAEPWLDEIRQGLNQAISFECDYCATIRRKRDVPVGTNRTFSDVRSSVAIGGKPDVARIAQLGLLAVFAPKILLEIRAAGSLFVQWCGARP